jgi:hypothetical protein
MPESRRDILRRRLRVYSNPDASPYDPVKQPDRRKANVDRRKCRTYLAKDQRSGIADRRARLPVIPDLAVLMRRKKRDPPSQR